MVLRLSLLFADMTSSNIVSTRDPSELCQSYQPEDMGCHRQVSIFMAGRTVISLVLTVISYPLEPAEHVTAVKNVNLEVSENTHERKDLIVVGTAVAKGEDIPARGCIYVFEVIEVVPEPGKPETGRRLKLVGKETVKGAVTALSGIGGQGFVLVAQGQKCMVRGLKEDGSLLPVAFMDMQCYVTVAKELKGTGMCLMGDAVKGLWFAGYSVTLSSRPNTSIAFSCELTPLFSCRRNPTKCPSSARTRSTSKWWLQISFRTGTSSTC